VSAVHDGADVAVAGGALLLLTVARVAPLAIVALCVAAAMLRVLG